MGKFRIVIVFMLHNMGVKPVFSPGP